ncbi:MAG: hypothetical protein DRJ42_07450 [Deltaproteobacteria bacterium]|nr:MAG: hypothetical protein DRJ42_07450 [Deltaproteobacteria bacterium]
MTSIYLHRFARSVLLALLALMVLPGATGCGGPQGPGTATAADLRDISEARAGDMIAELMGELGVPLSAPWPVNDGHADPFDADFRIGETVYGIEWVSPQDRLDYGDRIPEPHATGQLQTLAGHGSDEGVQILVLDHASYRYDPDRERVQHGATGIREVESRLRRDVRDFVEYMRGQGVL